MAIYTINPKLHLISILGSEEQAGMQRRPIKYDAFPMIGNAGPLSGAALLATMRIVPVRFVNVVSGGKTKLTVVPSGGPGYNANTVDQAIVDGWTYDTEDIGKPVALVTSAYVAGYLDPSITLTARTKLYLDDTTAGVLRTDPPFPTAIPVGTHITDGKNLFSLAGGNAANGSLMEIFTSRGQL